MDRQSELNERKRAVIHVEPELDALVGSLRIGNILDQAGGFVLDISYGDDRISIPCELSLTQDENAQIARKGLKFGKVVAT